MKPFFNVWCAAGKGTFGTEELAGRIESSGLIRQRVGKRWYGKI